MAEKTKRFTAEHHVPLDPAKAWRIFSDTDHFNRFVPLPSVTYTSVPNGSPVLREAKTSVYGLPLKWTEYPFEWVEGEHFVVRRVYASGPMKELIVGTEFKSDGHGGTILMFSAEITPRSPLHSLFLGLLLRRTLISFRSYIDVYLEHLKRGEEHKLPSRQASALNETRLRSGIQQMQSRFDISESLVTRFSAHLRDAADDEVRRMRPFVLADHWGEDRYATLEFFLYATKAGVLSLDWELMCPNCRVPKAEFSTFKAITSAYHCDLCGVDYTADLDRYTELRFSVSPEIRMAEDAVYCIGSPAKTPHVLVQRYMAPGEVVDFGVELPATGFRLRVVGPNTELSLAPTAGTDAALGQRFLDFSYDGFGWQGGGGAFTSGRARVRLRNMAKEAALIVLERLQWDERAVTASMVTSLQKFRDMFSSEVLAPGQQIGVRNLCVLFTDLKKSTELYELVGDAAAFSRVIRHFDYIMQHVARHHGSVVKTIGDAVMAVFPSPLKAVEACLEMQGGLGRFNAEQHLDPPLVLKMGIHHGAAIAVNANNVLDYFGRTVNLAARVQAESLGGDVMLSDSVAQDAEVTAFLSNESLVPTPYTVRLKGFEEAFKLWKVVPKSTVRRIA